MFDLGEAGNGMSLDARDLTKANWTRYVNHSAHQPTVQARVRQGVDYAMVTEHGEEGGWVDVELPAGMRVEFWTIRDIQRGEELLLDYGEQYWAGRPAPRGLLVGHGLPEESLSGAQLDTRAKGSAELVH